MSHERHVSPPPEWSEPDGAERVPTSPVAAVPQGWHGVRRILAVRLDNVGDVVMTGPALRSIRAVLPEAHVTLMASPAGGQVAPLLPWIDEVMVERVSWQDASNAMPLDPARERALVDRIASRRFDAAFVFTSFSQSPDVPGYTCYLAGIPIRVGQSALFSGSVFSQRILPPADDVHQVDRNLHLVEQAGFPAVDRNLEIAIPPEAEIEADAVLRSAGIDPDRPYAVVAPGASCPARRYDAARFAQVVRRLSTAADLPIVVVGADRERELVDSIVRGATAAEPDAGPSPAPGRDVPEPLRREIQAALREAFVPLPSQPVVSIAGRTTIPQLAATIRRARLLVANDSGPMHLADAVGTPMVILFSGTELERQWQPRRAPAVLLRRRTSCSPCYRFECPYHMECLDIEPGEAVRQALHLLATAWPAASARLRAPAAAAPPARITAESVGPSGVAAPAATGAHPAHRPARLARSVPTPGPARLSLPPAAHRRRNETDANLSNPDVARPRELPLLPRAHRP